MPYALELGNITKHFSEKVAVDELSLQVASGSFLGLLVHGGPAHSLAWPQRRRSVCAIAVTGGQRRVRIPLRAIAQTAFCLAAACHAAPDVPARLVAGRADTLVVNNQRTVRLQVRVFDSAGRSMSSTGVRYAWASGDAIPVSAFGLVKCARRGDATVQATLGHVSSTFLVRCRPVAAVRFPGSIELVQGDTAQDIPLTAYDPDNRPVALLAAQIAVRDTSVVALEGGRVRGRAWGTTLLSVTIGDHAATTGVRVYARAMTLDGLAREKKLIAVPVRLARGDMQRWSLPAGGWILLMLPVQDEKGLKLRVEGSQCQILGSFGPRRYGCISNHVASVIVYAPWSAGSSAVLHGMLAVKPDAETVSHRSELAERSGAPLSHASTVRPIR